MLVSMRQALCKLRKYPMVPNFRWIHNMIFFPLHSTNSCPPLGGGHSRTVLLPHRLPQGAGFTSVLPAGHFPKTCSPVSGLFSQSLTICWPLSTPCLESFLYFIQTSFISSARCQRLHLGSTPFWVVLAHLWHYSFFSPHMSLIPWVSVCSTCWGLSCPTRKKKSFFSLKWLVNYIDTCQCDVEKWL